MWAGPVETITMDTYESNEYIKDLEEVDTGKKDVSIINGGYSSIVNW